MDPNGADPGQRQMPAVRLDTHRSGGEAHPISVAALFLEARETHPLAGTLTSTALLPVPVRVDRAGDPVGVGLFRALRPPHLPGLGIHAYLVFDGVPAFPQYPKRRLRSLDTAVAPRVDVGFQGGDSPVECFTPSTEMPRQRAGLLLGRVQREPERLDTPSVRNLELRHHGASASSMAAAARAR